MPKKSKKVDPNKPLTPRQRAFVEQYLIDRNGTQAAIRAGYKAHTANEQASRLLAKSNVRAAVEAGAESLSKTAQITAAQVIQDLIEVKNRCMQAVPVIQGGEQTGEYQFNAPGANKALELIGKHIGMFTDKTQITGANGGPLESQITVKFVKPPDAGSE